MVISRSNLDPLSRRWHSLAPLLQRGGVHHHLGANNRFDAIEQLVERLPLSPQISTRQLVLRFHAREADRSTAIGAGLAIPHPRHPIGLPLTESILSLHYFEKPVPFGALDGRPVHAAFALVCPDSRSHLKLLAQLAERVRETFIARLLEQRAPLAQLLPHLEHVGEFPRTAPDHWNHPAAPPPSTGSLPIENKPSIKMVE